MDQGDGAFTVRAREVGIELPQLTHQKHTLVDDGAAGKRGNIGGDVGLFEYPSGNIQLPVKIQSAGTARRTFHKALADMGHTGPGLLAQHLWAGGNIPPAQKFHALLRHNNLQHFLRLGALQPVGREEEHPHAVIPLAAQGEALLGGCFCHELMGNLEHQAYAVAGFAGGIPAGAMLQFFYDF